MTYNAITDDFNFTINFADFGHGYYFQVYFVIYDLAGHGLDVAGNTLGPNLWTDGLPDYDPTAAHSGYDASFSYFDELKNPLDQPFLLQMGDINIQKINISENVLINDQNIQSGYNITSIKQNITIRLILTVDPSNYQTVNISYRFIPIINGSINSSIEYKTFSMNLTNIIGDNYIYEFIIPSEELNFNTILDFYVYYNDGANNEYQSDPFIETDDDFNSSSNLNYCMDETSPVEVEEDTFTEVRKPNRNNEPNEIVTWTNETVTDFNVTHVIQDIDGTGLSNVTVNWYVNGSLVPSLQQEYMTNGNINWNNASYYFNGSYIFNVTAPSMFFSPNTTLTYDVSVTDLSGNSLTLNSIENDNSNSFRFEEPPKPEIAEPEPLPDPEEIEEPATVIETIVTTDEEGNEVTIFNTTIIEPVAQEETNNALWIIAGFLGLLGLLTLYYQRHNIKDMIQQRRRRQKVKSVISDIIKEIRTLGEQEKYKRAVLLIWDALERISKEIVNSSRPFNVTAREFTAYLSTVTVVDRETLLTLSDTFESARYGKDNITKQVFENAINALENTIETIIKSGARSRVTNDDDDW